MTRQPLHRAASRALPLMPLRAFSATAFALLMAAGDGSAVAQTAATSPVGSDAKAIEALTAMGNYLRTLKAFAVHVETTKDEVLLDGQKIQFGGTLDYTVQPPHRLRAELRSDRQQRVFVYDGTTITQFAPRVGYYASIAAPGTIGEALVVADQKYGVQIPLADLFFWGTDKSGLGDIKSAAYLGPATIGGLACDHYAFRQDDVDWQLWLRQGKQPLPCKMVITTTQEPSQPQYSAVLKWNLAPKIDGTTFRFVPPKGASEIAFAPATDK